MRPRSGARFLPKQRQGALPSIFGAKKACFLQVSREKACFLQRKLLPVVICLSHRLSCSKKRFHARFLPGPPASEAKATGRPMSRRRASKRARQASRRQGNKQASRQADKQAGRQAGRQAGGTQVSHLAQAGTQAGRQAARHASRQAGRFDGKEKQGRPQRKPSILACRTSLGAKDVKSLRRGNPLFGGQAGRGHTSQHLAQAGTQAGRQAVQAGRQAGSFDGKEKQPSSLAWEQRMLNPCGWEIHCLGGRQAGGARVSHLAQTGTQAGRQACKQAGTALMGRKSKAGRNVNPPFLLAGRV